MNTEITKQQCNWLDAFIRPIPNCCFLIKPNTLKLYLIFNWGFIVKRGTDSEVVGGQFRYGCDFLRYGCDAKMIRE